MALRAGPRATSALLALAACSGCFFPEFTFDEQASGGGATITASVTSNGGASAVGGAGGGGGPPILVEDCFTAGDEDANGLSDCEDPACDADLECAAAIPVGWGSLGFVAFHQGSISADPTCPDGAASEVYVGFAGLSSNNTCTACDCGAPTGQSCTLTNDQDAMKAGLQPIRVRNTPCAVSATNFVTLTVPSPWDGSCTAADVAPGGQTCAGLPCNASVEIPFAATVGVGSCFASGGEPSQAQPTWSQAIKACGVETGLLGCQTTETCAPRPPPPFDSRVCVAKAGVQTCPAGPYSERTISHGDFDDTRGCTMCGCEDTSTGTCKVTVTLYDDAAATCNGAATTVVSGPGQCVDLTGNPHASGRTSAVTTAPAGGDCPVTAGGGVPTGGVTETEATTFCCLP